MDTRDEPLTFVSLVVVRGELFGKQFIPNSLPLIRPNSLSSSFDRSSSTFGRTSADLDDPDRPRSSRRAAMAHLARGAGIA
jgi:hypothetical protein